MIFRWAIAGLLIAGAAGDAVYATMLAGSVSDEAGAPVPAADVWAQWSTRCVRTRTDKTGRFVFSDLPAGRVSVLVQKEGYALDGRDLSIAGPGECAIVLASDTDRVTFSTVDSSLEPVAGVRVKTLTIGGRVTVDVGVLEQAGFRLPRSDAAGKLILDGLPKGGYIGIRLGHALYEDEELPRFPVGKEQDVLLRPGYRVRGRVTGPDGEGVANAHVRAFRVFEQGTRTYGDALTGPEGFYQCRLPKGEYQFFAGHPDYASPVVTRCGVENDDGVICDFQLHRPHYLRGEVQDEKGNAMAGVTVSFVSNTVVYDETLTSEAGEYVIKAGPGEGVLRAAPPEGYVALPVSECKVVVGDALDVAVPPLQLRSIPVVSGRAVDPEGNPVVRAYVHTLNTAGAQLLTDAEGRFRFLLDRVPLAGDVVVRVEHPERFMRCDFSVDFTTDETDKTVVLEPYKPDLSPREALPGGNDLSGMRGKPAPELKCDAWISSTSLSLEQLRGKVVVLTLWGAFDTLGSTPARMREIELLHEMFRDREDVWIISVHDAANTPEEVRDFVQEWGLTFPVGCDADPFLTFDAYNTNVIPQTVLIDKAGVLRYFVVDGRLLDLIKGLRRE